MSALGVPLVIATMTAVLSTVGWFIGGNWLLLAVYCASGVALPIGFAWAALMANGDDAERT